MVTAEYFPQCPVFSQNHCQGKRSLVFGGMSPTQLFGRRDGSHCSNV